jgi:hypothetical protein
MIEVFINHPNTDVELRKIAIQYLHIIEILKRFDDLGAALPPWRQLLEGTLAMLDSSSDVDTTADLLAKEFNNVVAKLAKDCAAQDNGSGS